jgi:membrane-associated phospholipid phosphatase
MNKKSIFFWQPKVDFLKLSNRSFVGQSTVVFLNYIIWVFLFFISYLLIRFNTNIFWQLLIATIIGEMVEKYGKSHALWRRPLFQRNDTTPVGLVDSWYKTGSFPSGHTIKAMYFLLFIIQYPIFNSTLFLIITTPLLLFRILIGFHYPVDMLGGIIVGGLIWLLTYQIIGPEFLTNLIQIIFNFVFFIK